MLRFRHEQGVKRHSFLKFAIGTILTAFIIIGASIGWWLHGAVQPYDSTDTTEQIITVLDGNTEAEIATTLEQKNIIKSALAYRLYARISGAQGQMQAGGYRLSPSMSVHDIQTKLVKGEVATDLITILPAQRLDQIKTAFEEKGYSADEIEQALDPQNYVGHPALLDLPAGATLEGYLYPESFIFTPLLPLENIVRSSLDELAEVLTTRMREQFTTRSFDIHQAIILASIVEREVSSDEDRAKVAQVFITRYEQGMMLGSDPTALYGALQFGIEPSVFADTPYNTRLYAGLPPGPINNVSVASLQAIANPATTDFLYFVSGDDGITYFSRTLAEHEALTAQHCIELCRSY